MRDMQNMQSGGARGLELRTSGLYNESQCYLYLCVLQIIDTRKKVIQQNEDKCIFNEL